MLLSIVYTLKFRDEYKKYQQEKELQKEKTVMFDSLKDIIEKLEKNHSPYLVILLKYYYEKVVDLEIPIDNELKEKVLKYCHDEKYNRVVGTEWCK